MHARVLTQIEANDLTEYEEFAKIKGAFTHAWNSDFYSIGKSQAITIIGEKEVQFIWGLNVV